MPGENTTNPRLKQEILILFHLSQVPGGAAGERRSSGTSSLGFQLPTNKMRRGFANWILRKKKKMKKTKNIQK